MELREILLTPVLVGVEPVYELGEEAGDAVDDHHVEDEQQGDLPLAEEHAPDQFPEHGVGFAGGLD